MQRPRGLNDRFRIYRNSAELLELLDSEIEHTMDLKISEP